MCGSEGRELSGPSSDGVVSSSQLSGERVSHREASGMPEIMGGEGVGDGGGGDGGGNGVGGDGGGEGCANDCNAVSSSSMTPAVDETCNGWCSHHNRNTNGMAHECFK